jgi:hypothetical protein
VTFTIDAAPLEKWRTKQGRVRGMRIKLGGPLEKWRTKQGRVRGMKERDEN